MGGIVAVGGTVFYFLKGVISSSSKGRLAGGAKGVVANAPCVARWAGWCGIMSAIESGMGSVCGVECPLNSVVAFAGASALFSARQGPRAAVRSGLKAAAFAVVLETTVYGLESMLKLDGSCRD
ncbi:mitochondrial import inner membrane translocase subunit TIM17-2-like [Brachypodium distachyon]|uniref:mitochondrial import inner membrane translocase subunit TIM17-2-like n=1 Tax=Brachypodium distachyon TaxID=15368 RepID=UPI00052FF497|nr:mitochondrial import inner membrane translocase subunit TIM17-2-like [Brachypodium distachyon]|eukprot:XP_010239330.1 mitochondrial import inner membrane translocase subunit TIM17-2-like [Brachypodium distachyon]